MTKGNEGDGIPQSNLTDEKLESNFHKTGERNSFFFVFYGTLSPFSTL